MWPFDRVPAAASSLLSPPQKKPTDTETTPITGNNIPSTFTTQDLRDVCTVCFLCYPFVAEGGRRRAAVFV